MCKQLLCLMVISVTTSAWGQTAERAPHVGYLYPAGGQQGTVVQIRAGGQFLRGASKVYVSGQGVRVAIVGYIDGNLRVNNKEEYAELRRRYAEMKGNPQTPSAAKVARPLSAVKSPTTQDAGKTSDSKKELPDFFLKALDRMNPKEIEYASKQFLITPAAKAKKQPNAQIADTVLMEITIDPGAAPGDRELRLATASGLTNPMTFQVGQLPEVIEPEPYNPILSEIGGGNLKNAKATGGAGAFRLLGGSKIPEAADALLVDLPAMLNGQILPGEVDRFRFRARQGQKLVIQAHARRLIPYLADAVPGWFQATLALFDNKGKELAYADDFRFDPDPVLFYEIPSDGEYRLEICDALYRGREDFVYRIAVGQLPFITGIYPLGGQAGAPMTAWIAGWNLPTNQLALDTRGGGGDLVRQAAIRSKDLLSNSIPYAVDPLPEIYETEPNDNIENAQSVTIPQIINGYIAKPGDEDIFRLRGRAGEKVVAEVYARRLNSPLDSLLRLTDAKGRDLALNDDHEDKATGLLTHHADSYLSATLPLDGDYYLHLIDAQHHGGPVYGYRLWIGPPRRDFALRVTPSSINVPAGRAIPVNVFVLRKDGFDGDIDLTLKDAPAGFRLDGGRIPGGRDRIRVTLSAPAKTSGQPYSIRLEGRARIGGQIVVRSAVPAEDMMQAFAYRHLTPQQELLVQVRDTQRKAPAAELAGAVSVRIPAGGAAKVSIKTWKGAAFGAVKLELNDPPKGVTLQDVNMTPEGMSLVLKADATAPKTGYADNLIVEAFTESGGAPAKAKQRVSLGVLPAIPFEIVQR
ncbi:MAG: hypothetical protein NTX50_14490 [Candidatus Sumerlaeota bacterium]|nr:hypothetical protein [Candidatus Sumerlaeota bacterium]